MRKRYRPDDLMILLGITLGALLVHGYHPFTEDAEIYLPGILKQLDPSLFPQNDAFFESYVHMSLFPRIVAASIRLVHLPVSFALLAWHVGTIFLLLYGCWRIARISFHQRHAAWCGVTLVAALLTIPVAGTALYIMDQYVTARSLSTPAAVLAVAMALEGAFIPAILWIAVAACVHPLMAVFATSLVFLILFFRGRYPSTLAPAWMFIPGFAVTSASVAYQRVLETRPYFFLTEWEWFEWLGILGPMALLAWFMHSARKTKLDTLALACRALLVFQSIFLLAAIVVSRRGRFETLAELQPLRSLHLLYIMLFIFIGGLLGKYLLQNRTWRWTVFFLPLCFGMWFAQRQLFPATPHLEWPWKNPTNPWVQAFDWIRMSTPGNAYFALDPDHMELPGEDQHGFRAIAQRSMLADAVKDSGAASMFPSLAAQWQEQVDAQKGWKSFRIADFLTLKRRFGVNWIVQPRAVPGLACPYRNSLLSVCRLD